MGSSGNEAKQICMCNVDIIWLGSIAACSQDIRHAVSYNCLPGLLAAPHHEQEKRGFPSLPHTRRHVGPLARRHRGVGARLQATASYKLGFLLPGALPASAVPAATAAPSAMLALQHDKPTCHKPGIQPDRYNVGKGLGSPKLASSSARSHT